MFIFEGKTEHESGRGRKRQNLKQAPGSELSAQLIWGSNSQGLKPTDCKIMTLAEVRHPTD